MVSMCFRRLHIHLNISQLLMTLSSQSGRIHHNETYFHSRLHFFVFISGFVFPGKKKVMLLSASQSVCECQSLREWQLKKEWKYKTAKAITENASNERGRGWRRGRVDSRTLGKESAALVMKRTDRELKGMKGGRRWRQQELKPVQCRRRGRGASHAWELYSFPHKTSYTFLFCLIVTLRRSKCTSLQTGFLHLLWPRVELLVALIGTESTSVSFKVLDFLSYCFPVFCCSLSVCNNQSLWSVFPLWDALPKGTLTVKVACVDITVLEFSLCSGRIYIYVPRYKWPCAELLEIFWNAETLIRILWTKCSVAWRHSFTQSLPWQNLKQVPHTQFANLIYSFSKILNTFPLKHIFAPWCVMLTRDGTSWAQMSLVTMKTKFGHTGC